MFQRRGTYLHRLSKLYSDTKQSYESAKVDPATENVADLPEVRDLRRDFQIQQDRLLAWGMHWADVAAPPHSRQDDVDIDKKIDQAGLTEVVASVISEIKQLLEESGRLEHPERLEINMSPKTMRGPGSSPVTQRQDWTGHELSARRAVLDRLTECIDLLYSLEETRRADEKGDVKRMKQTHQSSESSDYSRVYDHPLHIDFGNLQFSSYSAHAADPPPYDPEQGPVDFKERSIAYYRAAAQPVLVDYLPADCPPYVVGSAEDVFEIHELGEKLCKDRSLSWCGHLRLLGFTVDPTGPRCAMIYALPDGHDHHSLQQHRTLGSLITTSYNNHQMQHPHLDFRMRLGYNLALSIMGYFAQGETHQYINGGNVLVFGSNENMDRVDFPKEMKSPYLLQSCQDFLSRSQAEEPFVATIYRHPNHDVRASEVVPAYDIYSLGLLLLEVGLWIPLSKLWKPKYDRAMFMDRVQRIYSTKLGGKCGQRYMHLVQRCLQAPAELQFRNNYEDAGLFLLQVVRDLQICCVPDEEGPPPPSDIESFEMLIIEQMVKAEEKAAEEPKIPSMPDDTEFRPELPKRANSKRKADVVQQSSPPSEVGLRRWPEVDIPQDDLDQWNTKVMPKLGKILDTTLKDSPESCSLSLMMLGTAPEKARTTICIQCTQINKVRDVLRKRFKPKKGWSVIILSGEVRRSGKRRTPRRSGYGSKSKGSRAVARRPQEQKYQKCPTNGASIGAFRDYEHLPPVSFGGTILVDGEPYGMTVHHMLDTPSDDEEDGPPPREQPRRSAAPQRIPGGFDAAADVRFMQSEEDLSQFSDFEISDDDFEGSDSESDTMTIRPAYSITDDDGHEFFFLEDAPPELDDDEGSGDDASSSSSDDVDDAASVGDKIGVAPYSDDDFCVTQPAIDDVDGDFFPNEEDRDDDHLSSHSFGFVFASSGIRRVTRGEMKHEVDWALIRVHEERLKVDNAIPERSASRPRKPTPQQSSTTPRKYDQHPILTNVIPAAKLSGLEVHCRGRSSGFKKGRISQAMSLVRLRGRQSFSTSWTVEGGFGIPGDSGAWVYDPVSGGLCGHVLAWSDKSKTAYIAPMEVLFEDIRGRLGARCVELPVPEGVSRAGIGVKETEEIAVATSAGGVELTAKLRDLRIGTSGPDPAAGTSRKKTETVDVRPLVMAAPVS